MPASCLMYSLRACLCTSVSTAGSTTFPPGLPFLFAQLLLWDAASLCPPPLPLSFCSLLQAALLFYGVPEEERFSFSQFMDVRVARLVRKPVRVSFMIDHLKVCMRASECAELSESASLPFMIVCLKGVHACNTHTHAHARTHAPKETDGCGRGCCAELAEGVVCPPSQGLPPSQLRVRKEGVVCPFGQGHSNPDLRPLKRAHGTKALRFHSAANERWSVLQGMTVPQKLRKWCITLKC
eukprot:1148778-Pelagomonas_calceolata.AAC.5